MHKQKISYLLLLPASNQLGGSSGGPAPGVQPLRRGSSQRPGRGLAALLRSRGGGGGECAVACAAAATADCTSSSSSLFLPFPSSAFAAALRPRDEHPRRGQRPGGGRARGPRRPSPAPGPSSPRRSLVADSVRALLRRARRSSVARSLRLGRRRSACLLPLLCRFFSYASASAASASAAADR